jgi:antigen 43
MALTTQQEETISSEQQTALNAAQVWRFEAENYQAAFVQGDITYQQLVSWSEYVYDPDVAYDQNYLLLLQDQVNGTVPFQVLAFDPPNTITDTGIPCFCRGTLILTPGGEVPVEQLKIGDRVLTLSGEARPVTWIGSGRSLITAANEGSRPVIVRRDAIADGVPSRDLYVTGGHSLYLDGVLIPVEFLVNDHSVVRDEAARVVEFYHIELPTHDVLIADGAPAESYKEDGNRDQFHNTDRPVSATGETEWFAPVHTTGPVVDAVWRRLLGRSGFACPTLTTDPDVHLIADGERIDGEEAGGGVYRFQLERAPLDDLRIVSRSACPADIARNPDTRRLGVAICSIVLRGATLSGAHSMTTLPHDWPWLRQGFHEAEEWGARWTDGDARIPDRVFRRFDGAFEVVLNLGGAMQYPVAEPDALSLRRAA